MNLNPEITIGNLITAVAIIASVVGAYHALKGSVQNLSSSVDNNLSAIRELLRIHNDRVDRMERRYEERFSTVEETLSRLTSVVERLSGRWDGYERRHEHSEKERNK